MSVTPSAGSGAKSSRILALDTASGQCSVALRLAGQVLSRSVTTPRDHAQLLLPMVDEVLGEAGTRLAALDGIAFGCGPGSFTGLRIAAAVAQGLAMGADLPVLPVSDLRALAEDARQLAIPPQAGTQGALLLACMDARMGELYWGVFDDRGDCVGSAPGGERLSSPGALLQEVVAMWPAGQGIGRAAGMGLGAYPELQSTLGIAPSCCLPRAEPHAERIAALAAFDLRSGVKWLDAAAAQPVYLRDKVAHAGR